MSRLHLVLPLLLRTHAEWSIGLFGLEALVDLVHPSSCYPTLQTIVSRVAPLECQFATSWSGSLFDWLRQSFDIE
jgi:hypothetical protein